MCYPLIGRIEMRYLAGIRKTENRAARAGFKTILFALAALISIIFTNSANATSIAELSSVAQTPVQLSGWMTQNLKYVLEVPHERQAAQATLDLERGQCEDFAILAQAVLKRMGIQSQVVIIKYKGLNIMHAVAIYKEAGGTYSFFSNQVLVRTNATSIEGAISKMYPDWERLFFADLSGKYQNVALRAR
jgi:hypothetical protein